MDTLLLIHREHSPEFPATAELDAVRAALGGRGVWVETCLRTFWVGCAELSPQDEALCQHAGFVILRDRDAYRPLLEISCGLQSKIVGETEIFGQIKQAWSQAKPTGALQNWFHRLFEDTKEIRFRHLQSLGSQSYGSIVRKLISDSSTTRPKVLLIGAGQLSHSIAPWLEFTDLTIANRTLERALPIARQLEFPVRIETLDQHPSLIASHPYVIVCVPSHHDRDTTWFEHWRASHIENGAALSSHAFIHLGGTFNPAGKTQYVLDLEQIFKLQGLDQNLRSLQLERAHHDCRTKATLRFLGGPVGHGWEDLAEFA